MRIAYVHTGLWPSDSPSFTFVTLNAIALADQFEKCYLFVRQNTSKSVNDIIEQKFNTNIPNNLEIVLSKSKYFKRSNKLYARSVYRQLEKLILSDGLDAVITRNSRMLKKLIKIKQKYNTAVYFESHDFYADLTLREDINKEKKKKTSDSERKYIPQITGVICLQNPQKKLYEKSFPNSSVYLARTGMHSITSEHNGNKYLTYIGSLDNHKGLEPLLVALKKTKTKPHLLVIGGKNEKEMATFSNLVSETYESQNVTITGWIDKKEMKKYLLETAVGILPLRKTFFNEYLTSPLKLFDYYSCSIPVIASDLPTTRELIVENKTGYLYMDGDIDQLSEIIDYCFQNPDILETMRKEVYDFAGNLLWSKRAIKLKEIISEDIKIK